MIPLTGMNAVTEIQNAPITRKPGLQKSALITLHTDTIIKYYATLWTLKNIHDGSHCNCVGQKYSELFQIITHFRKSIIFSSNRQKIFLISKPFSKNSKTTMFVHQKCTYHSIVNSLTSVVGNSDSELFTRIYGNLFTLYWLY